MKTLKNLTAGAVEETAEPAPAPSGVSVDSQRKGAAVTRSFITKDGVFFTDGARTVKVPHAELWRLVQAAEPGLEPPGQRMAEAAAAAKLTPPR